MPGAWNGSGERRGDAYIYGGGGGGRTHFVTCLGRITIGRESLSRRSTVSYSGRSHLQHLGARFVVFVFVGRVEGGRRGGEVLAWNHVGIRTKVLTRFLGLAVVNVFLNSGAGAWLEREAGGFMTDSGVVNGGDGWLLWC